MQDQQAVHLPKIYLQAEVNQFLRNESAGKKEYFLNAQNGTEINSGTI